MGTSKITPVTVPMKDSSESEIFWDKVTVIFFKPSGNCPYRQAAYEYIRRNHYQKAVNVIEVSAGKEDADFNKASLLNAAMAQVDTPIAVVSDADVFTDPLDLDKAIVAVQDGKDWATPNSLVKRMTEQETRKYIRGGLSERFVNEGYGGQNMGGLFVISTAFYRATGGFDMRFRGWGGEDAAYSSVCRCLGTGWKPPTKTILWHLWHPEQPSKVTGQMKPKNQENTALWNRYANTEQNPELMRVLISERFSNASEWREDWKNIIPIDFFSTYKGDTEMDILITKSCITSGGMARKDEVVQIGDHEGNLLFRTGCAVPYNTRVDYEPAETGLNRDTASLQDKLDFGDDEESTPKKKPAARPRKGTKKCRP